MLVPNLIFVKSVWTRDTAPLMLMLHVYGLDQQLLIDRHPQEVTEICRLYELDDLTQKKVLLVLSSRLILKYRYLIISYRHCPSVTI